MNIFVLSEDVAEAARSHLDRHVVKMVVEYAQLLSTAHRVCDGRPSVRVRPFGRTQNLRLLADEAVELREVRDEQKYVIVNPRCYSITHQNHPSAVWARETRANYLWLYALFQELSDEYTFRYDRIHKTWNDLGEFLREPPTTIKNGNITSFAQAMGDEFKVPNNAVMAYRNYYNGAKASFATWKRREAPSWFSPN